MTVRVAGGEQFRQVGEDHPLAAVKPLHPPIDTDLEGREWAAEKGVLPGRDLHDRKVMGDADREARLIVSAAGKETFLCQEAQIGADIGVVDLRCIPGLLLDACRDVFPCPDAVTVEGTVYRADGTLLHPVAALQALQHVTERVRVREVEEERGECGQCDVAPAPPPLPELRLPAAGARVKDPHGPAPPLDRSRVPG